MMEVALEICYLASIFRWQVAQDGEDWILRELLFYCAKEAFLLWLTFIR